MTRNTLATLFLLLAAAFTWVNAGENSSAGGGGRYVVQKLQWGAVKETPLPLAGSDGSQIGPLPGRQEVHLTATLNQNPNRFYLRKRFGWESENLDDEYDALYEGQADPRKCYRGLNYFIVGGHSFEKKARMRYYAGPSHEWFNDIKDVYFQDSLVLAQASNLYYHPTGIYDSLEQARRVPIPPFGCLEIHTSPPGAQVFLSDHNLGRTPIFLSGLKKSAFSFKLVLPGFQTVFLSPPFFPESTLVTHDTLINIPVLSTRRPDLKSLLKSTPKSHGGFAAIKENLANYVMAVTGQRDSADKEFNRHYPDFMENKFESRDEFNRRRTRYEKEKQRLREEMLRPYAPALFAFDSVKNRLGTPWDTLKAEREKLECRVLTQEFPATQLVLDSFNTYGYRTFAADIKERNFRFKYRGSMVMTDSENKDFESRIKDAKIQLEYWNIPWYDSTRKDYLFFGLKDFRIKLDALLKVETYSGFEFDAKVFNRQDSLYLDKRISSCKSMDFIKPKGRKAIYWIVSGAAAAAAATGGVVWFMNAGEKKEKTYPIPIGTDDFLELRSRTKSRPR